MYTIKQYIKFWLPLILIIAGCLFIYHRVDSEKRLSRSKEILEWDFSQTNKLYAIYTFRLSTNSREALWIKALSNKLHAKKEVSIVAGRIDVVSDDLAIEVEKIDKWHEGIGQALHYGLYTSKQPTLAIIAKPPKSQHEKARFTVIEAICSKYDINLILMMPQ